MSIDAPTKADSVLVLVDWLELVALFAENRRAKLDAILGAFEIGADTCLTDIAEDDAFEEDYYSLIADEVAKRAGALDDDAYPFEMSENGEMVTLRAELTYGQKSYLMSLIHDNSRGSGKLSGNSQLTKIEAAQGRTLFEIFAVFASHGFCDGGHTFYIGSNRRGAENLLQILDQACLIVQEGVAEKYANLPVDAPDAVNDGGVDVIAVHQEPNGPPHRCWHFGQAAIGANFTAKSAISALKSFDEVWFSTPPANRAGLMLIGPYLADNVLGFQTRSLGHILDRMRLPKYVQRGRGHFDNDNTKVHYLDDPEAPCVWLDNYLNRVREIHAVPS